MTSLQTKKYQVEVDGFDLVLYDLEGSRTLGFVIPEAVLGDEYGIRTMQFNDNDVVVDIGANVGSLSILLAKKYPNIKIYAYEAHPINYENLLRNIKENNVDNVYAFNKAVYSEDDYLVTINLNSDNTGASNLYVNPEVHPNIYNKEHSVDVSTITLDTIIESNGIEKIKFLKLDCEGAEFEIIENSKLIDNVPIEYLAVEIHLFMETLGKNRNELIKRLREISKHSPKIKLSGL